jgi:membrane-associated protease RseP (regulator of RpoE activity)
MLGKHSSLVLAVVMLGIASRGTAQPEDSQERAARERELAQERAAAERDFAREQAAAQRDIEAAEREWVREQSLVQREWQREIAKAREEMARAVGDVARLSAQMREPALQALKGNLHLFAGGQPVLGLNIEDSDFGVFVNGVTPNGPAATAGVAVGDTIVSINDVELARREGRQPTATLLGQIGNVVPGDEVKLRILRGGDYRDVVVMAGDNRFRMPYVFGADNGKWSVAHWMPFRYAGAWNDIELVSLTPALGEYFGVDEGLLVVSAGRASELGFRDGDVLIDLAGRKPQSPEHALRILASFEPGESLQAGIMRQRRRESLAIRVPTE